MKRVKISLKAILSILIVLIPLSYYLLRNMVFNERPGDSNVNTTIEIGEVLNTTEESRPFGEVSGSSSTEAITNTLQEAKIWSEDAELFSCSGTPQNVGSDTISSSDLDFYNWSCMYYSASLLQTKVFKYFGEKVSGQEPNEVLDCVRYIYDQVKYPENYSKIVDIKVLYEKVLENGLNKNSSVNFLLRTVSEYGYVWRVDERAKRIDVAKDSEPLIRIYIFDIFTGELIDTTEEGIPLI
jgi:hypothetical protein